MRVALFAAVSLFFACGSARFGHPRIVAPLQSGTVPFHLIISNQSFDTTPVDVEARVDGVVVVQGDFEVGSQHTYRTFDFLVPPGPHEVRVTGLNSRVERRVSFDASEEMWGVLMFWHDQHATPAIPQQFAWDVFPTAPAFD